MIQTILAFFGYVKVPKEAELLAIKLELTLCALHARLQTKESFADMKNAQAVREFLRTGRLVSGRNM